MKYNYSGFRRSLKRALRHDKRTILWLISLVPFDISRFLPETDCTEIDNFLHPDLKKSPTNGTSVASLIIFASVKSSNSGFNLSEPTFDHNTEIINAADYASRYFQRPATFNMSNIIDFHNDLMAVLIFISIFLYVLFVSCICHYATFDIEEFYTARTKVSRVNHDGALEIIFTVVPGVIIAMIAMPSFALLYANND